METNTAYKTPEKTYDDQDIKASSADRRLEQLMDWADSINVAEDIDADTLTVYGERVLAEYEIDEESRADWKKTASEALDAAKLKRKGKNYPWPNASDVKYPLLTTAAFQFAARAYPAIVDGQRVVKAQVIGDDRGVPQNMDMGQADGIPPEMLPPGMPAQDPHTGEPIWKVKPGAKRAQADRVSRHLSYQVLNEMEEWEEDTDYLLHQLPIVGCAFRKVFYDQTLERNRSEMISGLDFVVNQKTKSLDTCPRATHVFTLYPHEIEERIAAGEFLDAIDSLSGDSDLDSPHEFLEQHRYLDLDRDGVREPWIVTIHKESSKVVRIVANFDPDTLTLIDAPDGRQKINRIARYKTFVKYSFFRDPTL